MEDALAYYYLRSDGPFGSEPLRYVDTGPHHLSAALGVENGSELTQRIIATFSNRAEVIRAFSWALPRAIGSEGPGWFRYLILSCMIASISTDLVDEGDYRERLRLILRFDSIILDLRGIATLWQRLASWCESARSEGRPFRKVVLPDPGRMTHIGYPLRISFPSRRDRERFENLAAPLPANDPPEIISLFRRQLDRHPWSEGFRAAFLEFERRYRRGDRLLRDHAFWRFVQEVCDPGRSQPIAEDSPYLRLLIEMDEEIQVEVSTCTIQNSDPRWHSKDDHTSQFTGLLEEAWTIVRETRSDNGPFLTRLATELDRGFLAFKEDTWGQWSWSSDIDAGILRVLIHSRWKAHSDHHCASVRVSPEWWMSVPIGAGLYEALARSLGQVVAVETHLKRPSLEGGVRTSGIYLGRECVLPSIRAPAGCNVIIDPQRVELGELNVGGSNADLISLSATPRLSGAWRASISESDASAPSELRLNFVDRAIVHPVLTRPSNTSWQYDNETASTQELGPRPETVMPTFNGFVSDVVSDLLEAVYAGGSSGWSEIGLLPLLTKIAGPNGPRNWDLLRSLRDAGWLEAWVAKAWRARRWYLKPLRLVQISGSVMLVGSWNETHRERFFSAVADLGGKVEINNRGGRWIIPTLVAKHIDALKLSSALEIEIIKPQLDEVARAPGCWTSGNFNLARRKVVGYWSWSEGRFKSQQEKAGGEIRLERWARPRGDAADLFRVSSGRSREVIFNNRVAAILEAYRQNGRPLFQRRGDLLIALTVEGKLPDAAVSRIRLRHSSPPGLIEEPSGEVLYSYPVDSEDIRWLSDKFGAAIFAGDRADGESQQVSRRLSRGEKLFRARLSLGGEH
ncbi:hypothetical protein GGD65_003217 [Bradyrhizobium sp. CIR18]|uniref:hypothetical protein n=1 Tax=Bradyrhizobium sp. CIR18 TaxID=2663839 RepID=UPI001606654B|nr:hypothetical protein [Bradyrhizobium sp. CIR18]MBB4362192.1 hypothetical protein [Bradyrhizobium sp. CIR18]